MPKILDGSLQIAHVLTHAPTVHVRHFKIRIELLRPRQRNLQTVEQQRPVGQRRERVVHGLMGKARLGALALDRIPDRPDQHFAVGLALDHEVLCALVDCTQREREVIRSREDDDRHVAPGRLH